MNGSINLFRYLDIWEHSKSQNKEIEIHYKLVPHMIKMWAIFRHIISTYDVKK